jgi:hypothetical protein
VAVELLPALLPYPKMNRAMRINTTMPAINAHAFDRSARGVLSGFLGSDISASMTLAANSIPAQMVPSARRGEGSPLGASRATHAVAAQFCRVRRRHLDPGATAVRDACGSVAEPRDLGTNRKGAGGVGDAKPGQFPVYFDLTRQG